MADNAPYVDKCRFILGCGVRGILAHFRRACAGFSRAKARDYMLRRSNSRNMRIVQ